MRDLTREDIPLLSDGARFPSQGHSLLSFLGKLNFSSRQAASRQLPNQVYQTVYSGTRLQVSFSTSKSHAALTLFFVFLIERGFNPCSYADSQASIVNSKSIIIQ